MAHAGVTKQGHTHTGGGGHAGHGWRLLHAGGVGCQATGHTWAARRKGAAGKIFLSLRGGPGSLFVIPGEPLRGLGLWH
jgi:hypothetical protein